MKCTNCARIRNFNACEFSTVFHRSTFNKPSDWLSHVISYFDPFQPARMTSRLTIMSLLNHDVSKVRYWWQILWICCHVLFKQQAICMWLHSQRGPKRTRWMILVVVLFDWTCSVIIEIRQGAGARGMGPLSTWGDNVHAESQRQPVEETMNSRVKLVQLCPVSQNKSAVVDYS